VFNIFLFVPPKTYNRTTVDGVWWKQVQPCEPIRQLESAV